MTSSLHRTHALTRACTILLVALTATAASAAPKTPVQNHFRLHFEVDLTRTDGFANAKISVDQSGNVLREVRFRAPADLYRGFVGDGTIRRDGDVVFWRPPGDGGGIAYVVAIDHERASGGYDALVTDHWALFRGDDVFPPASISQRAGATASSEFSARLPNDWSIVAPFADGPNGRFIIDFANRNFDRPVGWIVAGRLGVRRDIVAGMEISVAGPIESGIQRIGMLALLRWTLPLLATELESLPPYISIVAAGEPMWRGGLSGPNSLYIHADRPLLSENATSTLLHEISHVLMPIKAANQHDWIDEGIAEFATLEILRRSGTISNERFHASVAAFARRGKAVDDLSAASAGGEIKAKAVTIFHAVDVELRSLTDGQIDIFDLIRELMKLREPVELDDLRRISATLAGGQPLTALARQSTPGFDRR